MEKSWDEMKWNERVRAKCNEKGIKTRQLGDMLGLSYEGGKRLVTGRGNPTISRCNMICDILGCTLDELFRTPQGTPDTDFKEGTDE